MIGTNSLLDRPIIVLGCNRSGTTLLFNNLSAHPGTWSLYIESQEIFYRHYPIQENTGDEVTTPPPDRVAEDIRAYFLEKSHNKEIFKDRSLLRLIPRKLLQRPAARLYKHPPLRLVEKTPANCFRIPLLTGLFPDARFLFLIRRGEDVVSSLMEGWKNWSGTGTGAWTYTRWHYLVPPGWQAWRHRPLQEICAFQWVEANRAAWEGLNRLAQGRFMALRHEDLMADPPAAYRKILEFCGLRSSAWFDTVIGRIGRRVFTTGGSAPRPEKWRTLHEEEVESVRHILAPLHAEFYPDWD